MNREWMCRWATLGLAIVALSVIPLLGDDSASVQVGWTIESTQTLSIVGGDPSRDQQVSSTFAVPEPSDADLARGHIDRENALRLNARSNTSWIVTAKSDSATMGTSDDGTYTKPIRDLQVRADDGAYVPLSPKREVIARGPAGHETVGVDYRVNFDASAYRPGDYRATVTYTISTP